MGKWTTVESKVNKKPKATKEKEHRSNESAPAKEATTNWDVENRHASVSVNAFAAVQQVNQRKEAEHQEKKEAQKKAKEENLKRKAAQRAVMERRRAAADRVRKEQDPTTWPILAEALVNNKGVIAAGFQELVKDSSTMSKPSLRLAYVMGILAQHTPRALDWYADEDDYEGNEMDLPLGPAMDDPKAAEVLDAAMKHANGPRGDVEGKTVVSLVVTYFGAKGTKKIEQGEGSAARAFVQLLLRTYTQQVLQEYESLQAVFVDTHTGKFYSKQSFYNFCYVSYQLLSASGNSTELAENAFTGFINALGGTDWYRGDRLAFEGIHSVIAAADSALEEGNSSAAKNVARKLDGNATVAALSNLSANGEDTDSLLFKLIIAHCLGNIESHSAVFAAVLGGLEANEDLDLVALPLLSLFLSGNPKIFNKWLQRVIEVPIASSKLLAALVDAGHPVDTAFAAQAQGRFKNIQGRKKIDDRTAAACIIGIKSIDRATKKDLQSAAPASPKTNLAALQSSAKKSQSSSSCSSNGDEECCEVPIGIRFVVAVGLAGFFLGKAFGKF